jgi:thiol-disulfide isomerase/thioredoxin
MHLTRSRRVSYLALMLLVFCATVYAEIPRFSARTLDGEFITNDSLQGRVVLVQFWATWCGYCRRDQPIVDDLESRFAEQGLIVLAVNVGQPEAVVRAYLAQSPRSSHVVMDSDVHLARRYGGHGFPSYVLFNEQGKVVGSRIGSQEESELLALLARAGLSSRSRSRSSGARAISSRGDKPMMMSVPSGPSTAPAKPRQNTVFVLANGERLESDEYTIDSSGVNVMIDGKKRSIALSALNVDATKAANKERGIELAIPANRGEIVLSF